MYTVTLDLIRVCVFGFCSKLYKIDRGFTLSAGFHPSTRLNSCWDTVITLCVVLLFHRSNMNVLHSVDFTSQLCLHYSFNTCSFCLCLCHLLARDIWYKMCYLKDAEGRDRQTHTHAQLKPKQLKQDKEQVSKEVLSSSKSGSKCSRLSQNNNTYLNYKEMINTLSY